MRVSLPALVTLALLATARGGPISSMDADDSRCATQCTGSNKFQYGSGKTYEFDYTAATSTAMEGASEDTARLSITATALVHVVSDCDMVLQLSNVQVQESDPESQRMRSAPESARAAALLERQPLRFSFQDGVVAELCPSQDDAVWALNVKRGVLSAFQNSMSSLDSDQTVTETDVSGECPVQYSVQSKGWYSTTVIRSKDLLACTDRHAFQSTLSAIPYTTTSSVQSLPLLNSTHECTQTVDKNGILSSATCTERHLFRPFSREASGAMTTVTQTLKYKTESRTRVSVQAVRARSTMVFEHASQTEVSRAAQEQAEQVLRQLCRDTATDIRPDTPKIFSQLVSVMRRVDASGLRSLYAKLQQNSLCANNVRTKKFFVDALPMVGSEAAVAMMTSMLLSDDVTGVEADMWLTSLALIQTPVVGMLEQVSPLLQKAALQEKALLPVSSLVNNWCQRQEDCSLEPAVVNIMSALEAVIGSSCYVNNKNMDKVMLGLRAIGNAGHVGSSASLLTKCVQRTKNPMEIRVAAAQAFRRMPCNADRDGMLSTFTEREEDSEMRIAAYLALMTCPDTLVLEHVQRALETETDEQVGSFVWSHLSNLQETSSPHKQAVRDLLKRVDLPAKFDLGRLQFSRNYEGSAFLQRLNSGAAAEANLVWSTASSLPRSAAANLTVDLFGRSLNLLDAGVRLEGLEYLLETLLGPYGYFGEKFNGKEGENKLDELKGSLYMRMFGNEMTFQRFQGLQSFTSATSFNMLDFIIKLSKDHDIALTHSMEFMDTEMTVPTSVGLPLSLTVQGTATVDLKASGKVDLRKVSAQPRSLSINGEIRPSGAVRVSGQMSVDALVTRAALRVTGTLHSSSALKARVDLDRGRVLSVELDVPEDKMEIFDMSSEFHIVHNTVEKQQLMLTENRQSVKVCSGDVAARITGLELCGELQYPNASTSASGPYFPLTGPVALSLALYKRDTLTSYKLLAKRVENKKKTMAQLSFNTPGSQVDRAMSFDLVIDHADKQLEISAASPWKKAEFKGAITASKKLMGVSGSFITDDVNTYAVTSEVKIDESKSGVTYSPLLEIRRPDASNVALTGMVTMETPKSATADLTLTGVTDQPLALKTALTNNKKEMSVVGSVAHGDKNVYSVRAGSQMSIVMNAKNTKIQVTPFLSVKTPSRELVSADGSALYNSGKILKADMSARLLNYKPASFQVTATQAQRKAALRYAGKLNVKSSLVSAKMDTIVNVKKGRLINGRSTLSYNVPRVVRDKVVLMAKMSDRSTKAYNKYTLRSSLDSKSYPDINTALKLNVDHKKKLSSGALEVKYGSNPKDKTKRVLLSATLARKIKNLSNMDLSYKMEAQAPAQNVDVNIKGKHSHSPSKLDSNMALTYGKGKDVSATLTLRDRTDKLQKLNGALSLQAPGAGLTLKSDLTQTSKKQWEHSLDVKTGSGSTHSLSTVYKTPSARSHELSSRLDLQGLQRLVLSGNTNLDWDHLQMGASAQYGKDVYGLSGSHKLVKSRNGKWNVEVTVPSRRMTLDAEAGKVKGNYEASVEAAWDADKDKSAMVRVEGLVGRKSSKGISSHKARLGVTTPLPGWESLAASVALDSSAVEHQLSSKVVLGNKKNAFTSSLVLAAPFNPRDLDISFKAETPYKGYGSMGLALTHKLDSAALSSKVIASLQKDQLEASLTAQNRGTSQSRDLEAQLNIRSPMRSWTGLRSLSLAAAHKDDGRDFNNNVDVKLNGQAYSYVMTSTAASDSNTGSLVLSWPKDQFKSSWSARLSASDLASTVSATWGADQRVSVEVTGNHVTGSLSGSAALQTPWTAARDWRAAMDTRYGPGSLVSSSSVKSDQRDVFSHTINSAIDTRKAEYDVTMTSPWTKTVSSKFSAKYDNFPMTSTIELSWEPRQKVAAVGSVLLNNWDDLDISVKVTTPVRGMRSLAAEVSNKVEGSEVVGQVSVDLGMRKNVAMETRVQRDVSAARVKVTSPWDQLRVMDVGYETAPGKVKADFKAVPLVGQYDASATWEMDDEFSARLRVNTPREDFPYLQVLASSKDKRRVSVSRVEVELAPRQTYSLDATYALTTPLVLDLALATPLQGYQSLSAALRHNMRDTAMDASAQMTYFNDQSVKATAAMDWSRGLDSSLTVSTPFSGWEQTSATLRHEGELDDFNSLADVTVAGQSVTGNLKFLNKMKTNAQLSITTPWAGWEKIEAGVTRKGDLSNLRGTAMVTYGDERISGSVLSKWNSRKARLVAALATPFTDDLKLSLDQSQDLRTDLSASYGKAYSVDATVSGSHSDRETSGSASLKYRLGGRRHALAASVAQSGTLRDLSLTASASLDKREVVVSAQLDTARDVKAKVTLRTPFAGFESLGAALQHSGPLTAMTSEANVEYMTDRNINVKVELSYLGVERLSLRAAVTSPLRGLESSSLTLSHAAGRESCVGSLDAATTLARLGALHASYQATGRTSDMKGQAKVSYNSRSLLDVDLAHKMTARRLASNLRLQTPALPEITLDVNHQGALTSAFTTKASASAGGDRLSSSTSWSLGAESLDLSQSFRSDLQGETHRAALALSRAGPLSDLTLVAAADLNARKAKVTAKMAADHRDVSASLDVESPFDGYRQLGASFRQTGVPSDVSVVASANLERQKMEVSAAFSDDSDVSGSVDVTTPFNGYGQMGASFSYGAENAMVSANLLNDKVQAVAKFLNDDDVSGSVDVMTPFNGYGQMGASFSYGAENAMVSANLLNDKVQAVAKFLNDDDVSGSVDVTTPFNGYGQMGASFNYGAENAMVSANLLNDKVEAVAKFLNNNDVKGSIDVTTPFNGYGQMGASFSVDQQNAIVSANLLNDKVEASAKFLNEDDVVDSALDIKTPFSGFRQLGASLQRNSGSLTAAANLENRKVAAVAKVDETSASLDVATPFAGFTQMGAQVQFTGDAALSDVTAVAKGNVENNRAQATVKFANNGNDASGSVDVTTPFNGYRTVGSSFSLTPDPTDMSFAAAGYKQGDKAEVKATLILGDTVSGSVDVSTIFEGFRQMGSSFSLTPDPRDLTFSAEGHVEGERAEVKGQLSQGRDVSGSVKVATPFNGYRQMGASFTQSGDVSDMSLQMAANLMDDKVQATATFSNINDISAAVTLATPFNGYRQMGASFTQSGEQLQMAANLMDDKVQATATFSNSNDISATVTLATPFNGYRQMSASFTQSGEQLQMAVNLMDEKVQATATFSNINDISAAVTLATPFNGYRQMGASFTHSGDVSDMSLQMAANLMDDKVQATATFSNSNDISAAVTVATPFNGYRQMGASFTQSGEQLQMAANLMDDQVQATATFSNSNDITATVTLATPFNGYRQVGAGFQHAGSADRFTTEGQVTYMDDQQISGKAYFSNDFRRLDASAELKTPFPQWEVTKVSYTHEGRPNKFTCTAALECSKGQHSAELKVDTRRDQTVQLTVQTPYDGFRRTELTHSLSVSADSATWSGALLYGRAQRASSQLTLSRLGDQFSSQLDLQTPFTSDLTLTFDQQGSTVSAYSSKQTLRYGDAVQFANAMTWDVNASPLWTLHWTQSYRYYDVSASRAISLRREGAWNDVTLAAKGEMNGEEVSMETAFKNEFGRIEGNVKVNTPFDGFSDVGASFQHTGEISRAFNTEVKVEYMDDEEVSAKLDVTRATWRRLEVTAQLTTPFEDWTMTQAEYRHKADEEGFTCYANAEYFNDQRLTGDLRVSSSPNPEVTLSVKTPFSGMEQMSATGSYQNDGWGKQEVSSNVDLGDGYVYTLTSAVATGESSPLSLSARVTTPHDNWQTVEARLSQEGHAQGWKSSAYLSAPLMDALSASASLRFNSPFDLSAAASLDTPFDLVKDWKMEMVNGEQGTEKTSHVTLGWSGDQEVTVDGIWRHDLSWYERHLHSDVSIVSPFQAVRRTNWVFEHHATQGKFQQKITGSLNGDQLVDLDLATVSGDLPEVTLTLREPRAMLYALQRTSDGAEATLDWDRNNANSNLRLTSRFTGSSDDTNTQHELELKAIHPTRTLGGRHTLQSGPQSTASQGELYWGRGANRRVFYSLDLNDLSRRAITSYEAKVKVGALSRAVQMTGAVSRAALSRQMDASVQWDADRDTTKQVAVKTSWTSGDRNKVDVTLSLPAINQEVRVQSSVAVQQGQTLLDATTAVSYSRDASKTLTLSSRLTDTSDLGAGAGSGNYTLLLTLTHPHSDLDLALTSHLGATNDRYSAAVDTSYLTTRRQRKNMALRGEIDQLRRQISMEMVSPVKKMAMKGVVKSVQPLSLSLTNTYDDDNVIQADVTIDTQKRSFVVKSNYDLNRPENTIEMKAYYVNSTAIRASVSRHSPTDVIIDALLALRLNSSTLLHSRAHWRSASLPELQNYAVSKLADYASRSKDGVQSVSDAVRDELSARYARSAQALAQDLYILLDLLNTEMTALSAQMTTLRRGLNRFYRRSPVLQNMGSAAQQRVLALQQYLGQVTDSYQQQADAAKQQMLQALSAMARYPVADLYQQAAQRLMTHFQSALDSAVTHLTQSVQDLDDYLLEARRQGAVISNYVTETAHNVTSHPRLQYLVDSLDLSPYVNTLAGKLSAVRMPQQYSAAIYSASSRVNEVVSDVMNMEAMRHVKQASNEIYQQGLWAYHYWSLEQNLEQHMRSIATLVKEIVEEEMEIYTRHFRFLQKSDVTVWNPAQGEVQAEIRLPVAMETLDSLPDVTSLVEQYNDVVDQVKPSMDTVTYFYDNYVPKRSWWSNKTTSSEDEKVMTELQDYTPTKSRRNLYKRKYNKRAVAAI